MVIYGLKTCDTCRKARKALEGADFVDVRHDGMPEDVLARAEVEFGAALLNTRSTTWRELTAAAREKPSGVLLRSHPTLMKRPLIEADGKLYLGWTKEVQTALLGG